MSAWRIRDAQQTDYDAILSLTMSAYEQYQPQMKEMWELYKENIVKTLTDVSAAISNRTTAEQIVVEAIDNGELLGSVVLFPASSPLNDDNNKNNLGEDAASPKIRLLAVAPSARGQGIATALMQECIHRSRRAGAESLVLRTVDMMDVAMQMYLRMGFERDPSMDGTVSSGDILKAFRFNLKN